MSYELPDNFIQALEQKYYAALENDDIKFNGASAVNEIIEEKVGDQKVSFQVTLLESLQHRPEKGSKETNPFAKPEPELTIVDDYGLSKEFRIIFNKFPVVSQHFMLVTKEFVSQNTPLSAAELTGVYSTLQRLKKDSDHKWFAFYNCGPQSGASQLHKHIQLMTLPRGFTPFADQLLNTFPPFLPSLTQEPLTIPDLPFAHFIARFPSDESLDIDNLALYFSSLLQRTLTILKHNDADHTSYNFIMTSTYMLMIPRSNGTFKESIGINSCGYVGLVLCKNKELRDLIHEQGPLKVLESCGFPNTSIDKPTDYHY